MWRVSLILLGWIEVPLIIFWDKIMIILGQQPEVANETWSFCWILFPATILFCLFDWNRRYLVWCGVANPNILINIAQLLIHGGLLFYFTIVWNLSLFGVGVSTLISNLLSFCALEIYTYTLNEEFLKSKWIMINREMLSHLYAFSTVWVPCLGIIILYWLPIDILTFVSGLFGISQLASITITNNIEFMLEEIYYGLGLICWAQIGNCLGMNQPNKAKIFAWTTLIQ